MEEKQNKTKKGLNDLNEKHGSEEPVLISIITVNRDNLEGLRCTMSSVFAQTFEGFEYIIIDGGSSDGSSEYILAHQHKLSYWISEPDAGIYQAMNKGISKAKGQFLLFLNSGDWLAGENVLVEVSDLLRDVDVLYGNIIKVFPNKDPIVERGPGGSAITLKTFFTGTLNHCSSFISKDLFEKYGLYDENLKIVSDWKFFLIALGLNDAEIRYIDFTISFFEMTGISISNPVLRDQEREMVLRDVLPLSIYYDYNELRNVYAQIHSYQFRQFEELNRNKIIRKLNSFLYRVINRMKDKDK